MNRSWWVLQWRSYRVGVGKRGNKGAIMVAERMNEDPKQGGAD